MSKNKSKNNINKAKKIGQITAALVQHGLLTGDEEEAILIGTLPILMDTRNRQVTDKAVDTFGKQINQTTDNFMKNARSNVNEIPDDVWDEALENEIG